VNPSTRTHPMPFLVRVRLGFLLTAILAGMVGMSRDEPRLVYAGIGLGLVGLVLRFFTPKPPAPTE
jgi:hypothetical protein